MRELLAQPSLVALGYALLHSVWVFALLVVAGQLTIKALADPSHRHAVLMGVLVSLPMVFGVLVYLGLPVGPGNGTESAGGSTLAPDPSALDGINFRTRAGRTRSWLPFLSVLYLLGLLIAGGRTTWAYRRMLRLRRGTLLPAPEWRDRYLALRRTRAPDSSAQWRLSAAVNQVLTVGVWKPLILFPLGLINELSPEEVQAILRHELAHLRRKDHLWQALQQVVATLFFYHPLIYWLCRSLDREREFACDDLVVQESGRKTYARALLRVATHSLHPKIPFTVSATDRSTFSHRLHRLFATETATDRSGGYLFAPLLSIPLFVLLALGPVGLPFQAAPDTIISGTVVDATTGEPLIGTTIMVKGTKTGTISDLDGSFRLDWDGSGEMTLRFDYVGYVSKEIIFDNVKDRELAIQLTKQDAPKDTASGSEDGTSMSTLPANVVLVVDGRVVDREDFVLKPSDIESINIIKDKKQIAKLGYDTTKEGLLLITTKKQ